MEDNENSKNKDTFLIIDGNSIINRAFYGIRLLTTKDGVYTNAVYGFLNIYYMIMEKLNPKYVAVTFDLSKPTFRHELYADYKGGRRSMPDELRPQIPLLKEILGYMNVKILELEGYEADDILGTVSKINTSNDIFTYILSGDRDTLQLISDTTTIVIPSTKNGKTDYAYFDKALLKEKYGITPEQVIDIKSLMGDSSDNIKGVAGIGEKTAHLLIEKYDNLENIYNNIETLETTNSVKDKLMKGKDDAFLSYKLATICKDVPINLSYNEVGIKDVDIDNLSNIFNRLSFKKFLDKYTGGKLIETKNEHEFYEDFENINYINLESDKNAIYQNLDSLVTNEISFTYFDEKCPISNFRNNVYVYNVSTDAIIYFNINSENVLKSFANSDVDKIGFDIKPLIKICFDKNIEEFVGFNNDVKIGYFLNNSSISNVSIDMIAYNLLSIVLPKVIDEKKNKTIQTSIFDMIDNNKEDKENEDTNKLSDDEKKYIYAYLKIIYDSNKYIIQELKDKNLYKLYTDIEMPLVETLANMESTGMYVDKEKLKEFGLYLDTGISKLEKEIYDLAGEEFNVNSPKQLQEILFVKLGLKGTKKNDSGLSTDKEVLESLMDDHEIIPKILEYRSMTKLKSTYVDSLLNLLDENSRLHTTFMQTVTATGRLSSVEPNLQNIPVKTEIGSKIRECFVPPNSNSKIIDADYSQIELRVLAHMSKDEIMIKAFKENKDIHTITASEVFDIPINEVTSSLRSKAKAVNFGIVYGISDYGLAKNINSSRAEAKKYIEEYKNTYKGVTDFMKDSINSCKEKGYANTLWGRRRDVPEIKSANFNTRTFGERVAMNMPIQGTAADIIKIAMNNIYKEFKVKALVSKIIMQVHDELVIESPINEVDIAKEIVTRNMQNVINFDVPLLVDINVGDSWLEAK